MDGYERLLEQFRTRVHHPTRFLSVDRAPGGLHVTVSGPQSGLVTAEPPSTLAPTSGSNYNCTFGIPGPLLHWPEIARASSEVDALDLDSPDTNLELSSLQSNPAAYHPRVTAPPKPTRARPTSRVAR